MSLISIYLFGLTLIILFYFELLKHRKLETEMIFYIGLSFKIFKVITLLDILIAMKTHGFQGLL